eukprot:5219630-Pyramimonas_sp.AAC.1
MQQTNRPDESESVSVRMGSVALPARVADRVQTSGPNRRTRRIIMHPLLRVSALQLPESSSSTENRKSLSR